MSPLVRYAARRAARAAATGLILLGLVFGAQSVLFLVMTSADQCLQDRHLLFEWESYTRLPPPCPGDNKDFETMIEDFLVWPFSNPYPKGWR